MKFTMRNKKKLIEDLFIQKEFCDKICASKDFEKLGFYDRGWVRGRSCLLNLIFAHIERKEK